MNGVSTAAALPAPMHAKFPDGGALVYDHEVDDGFLVTAHWDGTFRVWRESDQADWAYFPVQVVGMTPDEIRRSLDVACRLLSMPHNRAARRAMAS